MTTDRIQKNILLRATRDRVWRALTDSAEFGVWFGLKFHAPFSPGAVMHGVIVGTQVNPQVACKQKQYEGMTFDLTIESIHPQDLFSFRWHPGVPEVGYDYSSEPTTLIEFTLEDAPEGILLTVTESGFDRIPLARRAKVFTQNEQGWAEVITLIGDYFAQKSQAAL